MASSVKKQDIISALSKHLSNLSVNPPTSNINIDSLCSNIMKLSLDSNEAIVHENELLRWTEFAEGFSAKPDSKTLNELNEELITKSVLLGNGLTPSVADATVFSALYPSLIGLSSSEKAKLPHLLRWADYIQYRVEFGVPFKKILLEKIDFRPPAFKPVKKVEDSNAKKTVPEAKEASSAETNSKSKKSSEANSSEKEPKKNADAPKKKGEGASQAPADKKKPTEKEADKKEEELSVSLLKIQIGVIRKAWKHPSADSLLVEEIDTGDAKCRQVVSGLAKFCSPEELTNRRVVLITNVKPGKLRDIMSEGLVLCASNEDHTVVEPLIAPEGAKPGEIVTFSGIDGKPEEVLNPKKKQLDKITPNLFTDDKGVATFKGIPFMTSAGPCTSSIPKATIK